MNQAEVITARLQEALIYSCIVAGKSATFTDAVMKRLLVGLANNESLFDHLRRIRRVSNPSGVEGLQAFCKHLRTGNYTKLGRCFHELIDSNLDLATSTPEELEAIHGIGPKTSRFFILWTREGAEFAALDVHILRWLRGLGHEAPQSTPPIGPEYSRLQEIFLAEAKKQGKTPRELDAEIWRAGSKYQS